MKILKKQIHGFLPHPFELEGKQWLSAAVLLYFDLTDPQNLRKEQELWQEVPPLLGEVPLLDQGWPKPKGEFLLAGTCHAPKGSSITGGRVSVRVGAVSKELAVFGERRWQRDTVGLRTISEPRPFSEMPIDWDHAFGGEGFAENPSGKGFVEVTGKDGNPFLPLPEIEEPSSLIASPGDRPPPAGFGLVPAHLPRRAKLSGTYDKRWLRERWPGFPDDLEPEFFLAAPPGQQLEGFFTGGEKIEICNMHPDMPVITSGLPKRRVRLFFLKRPDLEKRSYVRRDLLDGEFFEARLNAETLWLFPDILRGVLLYRAVTPCIDDEYSDLAWAHVADEEPGSEPLPLEHYRDYVLENADFGQSVVEEKMQELQQKLGKGALRVRNLPKTFKEMKAGLEGRAPSMQAEFGDLEAVLRKGLQGQRDLVNELEAGMQKMQGKFGHIAPVNFQAIKNARKTIANLESTLDEAGKKLAGVEKQKDSVLKKAGERLKASFTAEELRETGIDPDHLEKPAEISPFHDRWFSLVVRCRMMLKADRKSMKRLLTLGLGRGVVSRNWLGWNEQPLVFPSDGELTEQLTLPEGLVIPRFEGAVLTGVIVRPEPETDSSRAVAVPGSDVTPRFLEAAMEGGPVVVLPDALAGFLFEEEAGDFAAVAISADVTEGLPDSAKELVKAGAPLVVVLPGENGEEARDAWMKAFPGTLFLLLDDAQDVFEARGKGTDLREELLKLLPAGMAGKHRLVVPDIAGDVSGVPIEEALSADSIKTAIEKGFKEVQAAADAKAAPFLKQAEERIAEARKMAASLGMELPERQPQDLSGINIAELMAARADKLDALRGKMQEMGVLPAEKASLMEQASARLREEGPLWQQRNEQLDTMEPPDKLKQVFAKHGIDVADLKPVTQDNLQERLDSGGSFRMVSFRKLDLSGIDFSGKDLSMARFNDCIMKGCRFDRAKMEGTMFQKCDLSEADFSGAEMERTTFSKCELNAVRCRETVLFQVSFDACNLTGADFTGSTLKLCSCRKGAFKDASLERSKIELASVIGADLRGARMNGAFFSKTMLKKCTFDGLLFSGIETDALLLHQCSGEQVRFENSKLFKLRIGNGSAMQGLAVENCSIEQGYFRDANLSGASFAGSGFKRSVFEGCDLTGADFHKAPLIGCQFLKSDLERADLSKSNLFTGSLRKARIVKADLSGSNLFGVDFRKCVMGGTRLQGANLTRSLLDGKEEELKKGRYIE